MKKKKPNHAKLKKCCAVCRYPNAEKFKIGDTVVELCKLHIAEYKYLPDGFLERHGIKTINGFVEKEIT